MSLEDLARHGERQVIEQAIEAPLAELLAQYRNVRTLAGSAVGRNGYLPERGVLTAAGPWLYLKASAAGVTLGYDANGNVTGDGTWTYGYDAVSRSRSAAKAGLAATLSYNPAGRLHRTVIGGNGQSPVRRHDTVSLI